jgi:hypothetical protein
MSHRIQKTILAGLCIAAAGAAMADVTVNFVDADHFTDLPRQTVPREAALQEFTQHFQKLSATLPPDQDLVIDVLDIDLAGHARPTRSAAEDLRIVTNGVAEWPHVVLRYTLSEHGGKPIASKTVELTDRIELDELHVYPAGSRYPREMRLIDSWWHRTVQPNQVAQR